MRANPAIATRTRTPTVIPLAHRKVAFAAAALAVGLLLGGCDAAAPGAAGPTAPGAPSASETSVSGLAGARSGDAAAVTAVVAAWDAAWNAGDGAAIGALFTEDAEFVNGRGQIAVGARAIGAQHAASLAGVFQGSHTEGTVRRITFLSGTAAVLDVDNRLTGFKSLPPGTVPTQPGLQQGRHKRLLVRQGDAWKIQLMQITNIAPAPAPVPTP